MLWKVHLKQTQQDFGGRILCPEGTIQSEVLLNQCLDWEPIKESDMIVIPKRLVQTSMEAYTLFKRVEANPYVQNMFDFIRES